jgi:hypothetical protein
VAKKNAAKKNAAKREGGTVAKKNAAKRAQREEATAAAGAPPYEHLRVPAHAAGGPGPGATEDDPYGHLPPLPGTVPAPATDAEEA